MSANPHRQIERAIGYRFRKKELIECALTHRSYRFEANKKTADNQRLEFLGDAVLGIVTATYLYKKFPELQEGGLTRLRSQLTSADALSALAVRLGLGSHLLLGRGEKLSGGDTRTSNLVDALEALVGAVYLDGGLRAAQKVFLRLFEEELSRLTLEDWRDNPKGALQERIQQEYRTNPVYRVVGEMGPSHAREFTVEVFIKGKRMGSGQGPNKRKAESEAARQAMKALGEQP